MKMRRILFACLFIAVLGVFTIRQAAAAIPGVTLTGTSISVAEGSAFSGTVATFTDSNGGDTAASFSVAVDWGDGFNTIATVTGGSGSFTVSCTPCPHTYAEDGSYSVLVTLTRTSDSTTASVTSTATVSESLLSMSTNPFPGIASEGSPLTGPTGTLSDPGSADPASSYTVTVQWGDGTTSTGGLAGAPANFAWSTGSHTYLDEGFFTITITAF